DDVTDVDQLARVEIANGSVAVVCRSKAGIYEVERQLRRLHGKRLGVIVLRTSASTYTLRLVNPYLPTSLERVYTYLNLVDPGAGVPSGLAASPAQFSVLLATLGGAFLLIRGLRAPGLYGLRRPAGLDWCVLLPFAIFGALAGGVWIPVPATTPVPEWLEPLGVLTLPLAAEVIFRGLVHGSLVASFGMQECGGPWLLSSPVILSAGFYTLW